MVLQHMMGNGVEDYQQLDELGISALLEVGNIMISAFANAMAGLTDMTIRLTVPAFAVDMQGAIIDGAHGGIRRSVRLHHDHRRRFHLQWAEGALPHASVSGYPFSEFPAEKAGGIG